MAARTTIGVMCKSRLSTANGYHMKEDDEEKEEDEFVIGVSFLFSKSIKYFNNNGLYFLKSARSIPAPILKNYPGGRITMCASMDATRRTTISASIRTTICASICTPF